LTTGVCHSLNSSRLQPGIVSQHHIAVFCNLQAGKGRAAEIFRKVKRRLAKADKSFQAFDKTWPDHLEGFDSVWLVGGDGTLNHFINKYPGSPIPVALFGGGSGNDFYWKLYGSRSCESQLNSALTGHYTLVDGAICNGRNFVNGFGIGFDAEVVKAMQFGKKISAGHLAYLFAVIKKICFFKKENATISFDGNEFNHDFFMITVANGSRYGGGFLVAPQALVNDGLLDYVLIDPIPALKRLFYLPQVQRGKHLSHSFVRCRKLTKISIHSARPLAAHIDGELVLSDKFDIRILPGRYSFIG